jgi:hypothetical protein
MWEPRRLTNLGPSRPVTGIALPYSEIALPRKPFGIGHMYIYTFLFRMADTMTSQNIDLSFWDTPYTVIITITILSNYWFMILLLWFNC